MTIEFAEGKVDVERARQAVKECETAYETDLRLVGAQSVASYVLPRESNGYEGYIRFPMLRKDDGLDIVRNDLRIYFSPRAFQPYRLVFVHSDNEGKIGLEISNQSWAHRIAGQLEATGVVKREIPKPYYGSDAFED
jgi:hypothetical protein